MKWDSFILSNWIALPNTILVIGLGVWATLYYEILQSSPFAWQSIVFWISAALYIILFSLRQQAENRFQQKLIEQSKSLETAVLTMPPESFMAIYGKVYVATHKLYKTGVETDNVTKEEFEWLIRAVLSGIITLTAKFDRRSEYENESYHANIMFFCNAYKSDPAKKKELEKILMFSGAYPDLDKLQGVLYLENKLTTNSKTEQPEIDHTIKSLKLALPVPPTKTTEHTDRTHVLPGAPYAFVTGELNRFCKTKDLNDWMARYGDFNESIMKEVQKYFQDSKNDVKSFVSMPLQDEDGQTLAILNIHKTAEGLLENDKKLEIYYHTMKPILTILAELVARWTKKD